MNRLLSLLLIASLLLTCAGCGGQASNNTPTKEDLTSQEPLPSQEEDTEPSPEDTEPLQEDTVDEPEDPYVRVIDPAKPMVALTFDDGPHPVYSGQILDILEENHAVATFFEVGRNVAAYPEAVQRMAELDCEIGNHSYGHKDLSTLSKSALLQELQKADDAFTAAGVTAPLLVRPPYGAVNSTVKSGTGRCMVTWTVDTQDWLSKDTEKVIDYIQSYGDLDGEIVLLHSIYESTVEAVRVLVPWLIGQGYQLVTVSELMAYYYSELVQPGQFYGYTYFTTHGKTDTPLELPAEPAQSQIPEEVPAQPATSPAGTPAEETPSDETATPPAGDAAAPEEPETPESGEGEIADIPAEEPELPGSGEESSGGQESADPSPAP